MLVGCFNLSEFHPFPCGPSCDFVERQHVAVLHLGLGARHKKLQTARSPLHYIAGGYEVLQLKVPSIYCRQLFLDVFRELRGTFRVL